MKAKDIYFKTMKFVWMKLGLGALTILLSGVWFGILFGLNYLLNNQGFFWISIILWLAGTGAINSLLNHYIGYLVKAGHVAIIAQAVTTGQIPDNQFQVAKQMVTSRFATSNVYFVIDKLVNGAVNQLNSGLQKVDNLLGNVPGLSTIISILQLFIKIALGYVDECCLGYTFYKTEDTAYKSAADGVVIYFQNWKTLLKNAAKTTAIVIVFTFLAWLLPFILIGALANALSFSLWIAVIAALMIALAAKNAFIDSFMLVEMMTSYMKVAPSTQITYDLYGKLCKLSKKFKDLFGKAQEEQPNLQASMMSQQVPVAATINANQQQNNARYCIHCGALVQGQFCTQCGNRI